MVKRRRGRGVGNNFVRGLKDAIDWLGSGRKRRSRRRGRGLFDKVLPPPIWSDVGRARGRGLGPMPWVLAGRGYQTSSVPVYKVPKY